MYPYNMPYNALKQEGVEFIDETGFRDIRWIGKNPLKSASNVRVSTGVHYFAYKHAHPN